MTSIPLSSAPGCVGSPLIRRENHPACGKCIVTNLCVKLAKRNEQRLAKALGIEKLGKTTGLKLQPGAEGLTIAELERRKFTGIKPLSKAGEQLQRVILSSLSKDKIIAALSLSDRVHVSHSLQFLQPDWVRELLLLIWDNDGEIRSSDLREFLKMDLGIGGTSGAAHAANFVNAMTNAGILTPENNKLKVGS